MKRDRANVVPVRLAIVTAAAAVLLAAPAGAAVRLAAVGAAGGEPCTAAPCPIDVAIQGAQTGDEVIIAPGTYNEGATILFNDTASSLNIHGQNGAPRPVITATGEVMSLVGSLGSFGHDIVRHLDLRMNSTASDTSAFQLGRGSTVEDVAVTNRGMLNAVGIQLAGEATIRNTTVWTTGLGARGIDGGAALAFDTEPVTMVHDTVWATGSGSIGIRAPGFCVTFMTRCDAADIGYAITLRDVLVRGAVNGGGAEDLETTGAPSPPDSGTIDVQYSDYVTSNTLGGPITASNNITGAPLLADPDHGDFHELPGSPTLDAGTPNTADSATDPDGRPRTLGAATDIGAYEAPEPLIAGATATRTDDTHALVTATVDAEGPDATVGLAYGITAGSLGSSVAGPALTGSGPHPVSFSLSDLDPGATYHATITAAGAFGAVTSPDLVIPTITHPPPPPPPPPAPPPVTAPSITSFRVTPSRFRAKPAAATLARKAKTKTPSGSTFAIGLDKAASVKITIARKTAGIRVGKSCIAPSKKHRHAKRCTRTLTIGSLTTQRPAGTTTLAFAGRFAGRPLSAHAYTASAIATGPTGLKSATKTARFTIVRR